MSFTNTDFWHDQWKAKIDGYLQAPPRAGALIKWLYGKQVRSTLEEGAGSSRDSLWLAENGYEAVASDFDTKTIDYLKDRFHLPNLQHRFEDGFNLTLGNDSVDLVFHNGFFVLFRDDEDILKLIREAARVSRRYLLFIVHNGQNAEQVARFGQLAKTDTLFDIRFFLPDEIRSLVERADIGHRSIRLLRYGGASDAFYRPRLKGVVPNFLRPLAPRMVPALYQHQPWERTDRIACAVEMG